MQATAIDRFGGLDTMRVQTLPVPEVGPGEILIRIESAGVGVWDMLEREGGFAAMFGITPTFPYVLGSDCAGTIAPVGERVGRFQEGDRVYAFSLMNPKGGCYAEYVAVNADLVSPIPGGLTTLEAGAMPVDAMTALRGLDDNLKLQAGESVIILGAGGGIGHLAVQLAKRMGARVRAIASGDDGLELAASERMRWSRAISATCRPRRARSHPTVSTPPCSPPVDGRPSRRSPRSEMVAASPIRMASSRNRRRGGVTIRPYDGTPDPQAITKLNRLIEAGPFTVHIARTFSLDQAAEAHRELVDHYLGKIAPWPR